MAGNVVLNLSSSAINAVVGGATDRGVQQAAEITKGRVQSNIQHLGRVDTGKMRNNIVVEKVSGVPLNPVYRVRSTEPYTLYQEHGTRAHGPVQAKMLRFRPKGQAAFVFAKWVRGINPGNFFRNALSQLSVRDFLY